MNSTPAGPSPDSTTPSGAASRPQGRRPFSRVTLAVACSLLLTALAASLSWRVVHEREQARVGQLVAQEMGRLDSRGIAYLALLRATRSFVQAEGPDLQAQRFATFVAGLRIPSDYPGLQGIGWSPRVAQDPDRFEIRFLEPLDARNQAALGFDMHSEPVRAAAMDHARDSGESAMSGGVILKQEIYGPTSPGFLIYEPVYRGGGVPASLEDRRRLLLGFVYAPLRAVDFFEGVFRDSALLVRSVRVAGQRGEAAVLYGEDSGAGGALLERQVVIAGQRWLVQFERPAGAGGLLERIRPALVLLAGLLVTALLWALARSLAAKRRQAEERARALGQQLQFAEMLVGIVSHDLRNPLNVIRLNSELLARARMPEPLARSVQRIGASAATSLRLVRDLLDFTQARLGGGIPVARSPGRLDEIVQRAVEDQRAAHPGREIALHAQGDTGGEWDADRIGQLIANLVSNALAYGDPQRPVSVTVRGGPARIALGVHNWGEPIPASRQSSLFEPLHRGSQGPHASRNIGLGLYIVQQIARAHGGEVVWRSSAPEGTCFEVVFSRGA